MSHDNKNLESAALRAGSFIPSIRRAIEIGSSRSAYGFAVAAGRAGQVALEHPPTLDLPDEPDEPELECLDCGAVQDVQWIRDVSRLVDITDTRNCRVPLCAACRRTIERF